jgi:DNA-binding IclR family transcriptional regulator
VRCISAPVFSALTAPVGCIGIDGPSVRMTDARLPELAEQVVTQASRLTAMIAGSVSGAVA